MRKSCLKKRAVFTKILVCAGGGIGVALSNVAFASCEREKVKCYMNFLRPENIFLFNLWQDPGPTRDFSHLLSAEFYQGRHFVKQTCEKVDFEKRAVFSNILFCAGGGIGVALSNVAFPELRTQKSKMLYEFFGSREHFSFESLARSRANS